MTVKYTINELIERWNSNKDKPFKGGLIDWSSYDPSRPSLSCMCAQGQVLHAIGGWKPERLRAAEQIEADRETATLLNISRAHAVLLRQVNDSVDGAPSIVLTDPGKVLGGEWSKLLDFWWHMDQMKVKSWAAARDAAWDAASARAWRCARDAAGAAARAAAGAPAWTARNAAWEIQAAHIFTADKRPFYFLPMFGFSSLDDIPPRPENYGE